MAITPITSWRRSVYIAKFTGTTKTNGNQSKTYDSPVAYTLNIQPLSDSAKIELFGANAKKMYKAVSILPEVDVNDFDVAWLFTDYQTEDADYIVRRSGKGNIIKTIYFESIKGV